MADIRTKDGYKIFNYSNEGNSVKALEPLHVHIENGAKKTKFWITFDGEKFGVERDKKQTSKEMSKCKSKEFVQLGKEVLQHLPEIVEDWVSIVRSRFPEANYTMDDIKFTQPGACGKVALTDALSLKKALKNSK